MILLTLLACPSPTPTPELCLKEDVVAGTAPLASLAFAASCIETDEGWEPECLAIEFELEFADGSRLDFGADDLQPYLETGEHGLVFGVRGSGDGGTLPDGLLPMVSMELTADDLSRGGAAPDFDAFPGDCGGTSCSGVVALAEVPESPGSYRYLLGVGDAGRIEAQDGVHHDGLIPSVVWHLSGEVQLSWKEIEGFPSAVCDGTVSWRVPGE